MKEFFELVSLIGGAVLAFVVVGAGAVYTASELFVRPECKKYGEIAGKETYYSFMTDCLVKQNGEWVKWEVVVKNKQEITIKNKGE